MIARTDLIIGRGSSLPSCEADPRKKGPAGLEVEE